MGSSATGYTTENLLPPQALTLSMRTFVSGNPIFLPNGTEIITVDPRAPKYVPSSSSDSPSPLMDENWEYLLKGRYFPISTTEGQNLWRGKDEYKAYFRNKYHGDWDMIAGGFDTFHSLHCLNELRKRFYPEFYPPDGFHGPVHDYHCINHLRQVLQCSSVATIIPSLWRPTVKIQYSDAAQPHVCRDFQAMHNFTRQRYERLGDGALKDWKEIFLRKEK
ncbi:uncharacterized protein MYCFIDRAFT_157089 [Pseudocercospora fijiensis CIRAD86]|uniref:Uncharacterized protein n=1 Tax=Pseudocercospora fijiensis (strain CIRAD86) TaxID=383855 RepID=M3A1L7_PSEFD|nr:uncharacterized protein MYCFIDRAFT_157089 [Pseudocercospora fijiensis CIRAD86]EME78256.1 hypothetical protein MYCFIDRAFT_157089 [Pseudocercospora fijiensis CIRAD86]